jgi:transmembrane sensor
MGFGRRRVTTHRSLFDSVRERQDALIEDVDTSRGRARLVSAVSQPRARRSSRLPIAFAFAATVTAVVGGTAWWRSKAPLAFDVDGTRVDPSAWIDVSEDTSRSIRFSDGTELGLNSAARVKINELSPDGARIVLDRGSLRANVVHRNASRWLFDAGPFQVRVTGTRFALSWDEPTQQFHLSLDEGSVMVSGPGWAGERRVGTGERLDIDLPDVATATTAERPSAPSASASDLAAQAPLITSTPLSVRQNHRDILSEVRALAKASKYRDAYAAADKIGIHSLGETASVDALALLADVARLSGHPDEARRLLERMRSRFPGTDAAANAAFLLGRMSADGGQLGAARNWFIAYLNERPMGALAADARGRILESAVQSGDERSIRAGATDYLARHPKGPHAEMAERVLRDETP